MILDIILNKIVDCCVSEVCFNQDGIPRLAGDLTPQAWNQPTHVRRPRQRQPTTHNPPLPTARPPTYAIAYITASPGPHCAQMDGCLPR